MRKLFIRNARSNIVLDVYEIAQEYTTPSGLLYTIRPAFLLHVLAFNLRRHIQRRLQTWGVSKKQSIIFFPPSAHVCAGASQIWQRNVRSSSLATLRTAQD
jgi:hypothetical protein